MSNSSVTQKKSNNKNTPYHLPNSPLGRRNGDLDLRMFLPSSKTSARKSTRVWGLRTRPETRSQRTCENINVKIDL